MFYMFLYSIYFSHLDSLFLESTFVKDFSWINYDINNLVFKIYIKLKLIKNFMNNFF